MIDSPLVLARKPFVGPANVNEGGRLKDQFKREKVDEEEESYLISKVSSCVCWKDLGYSNPPSS